MSADDLKFYLAVATGEITSAAIRNDNFEAMAADGYIDFEIQNTDSLDASFYVELENCTNEVLSVPSQQVYLASQQKHESSFKIHTTMTEGLNYTCFVILKDANHSRIDEQEVGFSTSAQVNETVDQGDSGGQLKGEPAVQEPNNSGGSCGSCMLMVPFLCYFMNMCILKALITIAFIIVGILFLVLS
mmetsp:Transcript_22056/g.21817  ORF Transcript_22056/g.21817 Transcript_22056/m.21817 type:complete len:188 (-) Transcript_22056:209-772(-)